ncbi:MAG: FeoA domain-containing protein [Oscillospiraceae bacterium]
MKDVKSLETLNDDNIATVLSVNACGEIRRRLQDIGIINGTKIKKLHSSPLGDPTAYLIRGAVIALRSDDATNIIIQ